MLLLVPVIAPAEYTRKKKPRLYQPGPVPPQGGAEELREKPFGPVTLGPAAE